MTEEYRLQADDAGKTLEVNNEDKEKTVEVIVPNNNEVPFDTGTELKVYRANEAGAVIKPATGVILNNTAPTFYIPKFTEAHLRKKALNSWRVGLPAVYAAGGDLQYTEEINGSLYRIHLFTSTGNNSFDVLFGIGEIEYLIAGGGGAGGDGAGGAAGGGGAGGAVWGSTSVDKKNFPIVVAKGGDVSLYPLSTGENGENSSFLNLIAYGGGGGGGNPSGGSVTIAHGADGASGGGGYGLGSYPGGNAIYGQGSPGGLPSLAYNAGGGGGGFLGAGQDGSSSKGGNGGNGKEFNITGERKYYCGGGGGAIAADAGLSIGIGGIGGGGNGGHRDVSDAIAGESNTGGGGGGGSTINNGAAAAPGGSGIVIVRYRVG